VWPLLLTLCKDPVHAVRVAAATQAGGVLQHIPAAAGPLGIHLDTPASPDVTSDPGDVAAGDLGHQKDAPKAAAADVAGGGVPSAAGKDQSGGVPPTDNAAGDTGVPSDQSSRAGDTAATVNSSRTGSNAMGAAIAADAAGPVPAGSQQPAAAADASEATHGCAVPSSTGASNSSSLIADAPKAAAAGGAGEGAPGTAPPASAAAANSLSRTSSSSSSGSSSDAADGADLDRGRVRGGWLRSSFTSFLSTGWGLGSHLLEQAVSGGTWGLGGGGKRGGFDDSCYTPWCCPWTCTPDDLVLNKARPIWTQVVVLTSPDATLAAMLLLNLHI
jgi:hypothetical protein